MPSQSTASNELPCAPPVFFLNQEAPENVSHIEIFEAAEAITGFDSIVACQRIGSLWRLHGASLEVRAKLVTKKLLIRGVSIPLLSQNPFSYRDSKGNEIPSTKLTIDGVPVSITSVDLEGYLKKAGAKLRSPFVWERARYPNGKQSRCATGRRFVWIDLPTVPLPKKLKISTITASLYYREQPKTTLTCFACGLENHRRGDPQCKANQTSYTHAWNSRSQDIRYASSASDSANDATESEFETGEDPDDIETQEVIGDTIATAFNNEGLHASEVISSAQAENDSQESLDSQPNISFEGLNDTIVASDKGQASDNESDHSQSPKSKKSKKEKKKGNKSKTKLKDLHSPSKSGKGTSQSGRTVQSVLVDHFSPAPGRKRPEFPTPSPDEHDNSARRRKLSH